jgi:hypothetical protein
MACRKSVADRGLKLITLSHINFFIVGILPAIILVLYLIALLSLKGKESYIVGYTTQID